MERTPRLDETRVQVLSHHHHWMARRHLKTLVDRIVGLRQSDNIRLTAWPPDGHRRAVYAQSTVRRLARWLEHERLAGHALYGPLIQQARAAWRDHILSLALDTSMLWNPSDLVRPSLVYRGRAIPLGWKVLEPSSSRGAYDVYRAVWEKVAEGLPCCCPVVLTADRGFADTHLRAHLTRLAWHWRMRINGSSWSDRHGTRRGNVNRLP